MASASGGGASGRTPKIFKFSTPLEISILDQNDDAYEENFENHTELEICLGKLKHVTMNIETKATVQFLGLEKGIATWGANSSRDVNQFCVAVRKKEIQMRLNNYIEKKKLKDTLKLGHGKTIDIDIKITSKNLKEKAKEHFEGCEVTKTVPDDTTRQKSEEITEETKDVTAEMSEGRPSVAGNGEAQIKHAKLNTSNQSAKEEKGEKRKGSFMEPQEGPKVHCFQDNTSAKQAQKIVKVVLFAGKVHTVKMDYCFDFEKKEREKKKVKLNYESEFDLWMSKDIDLWPNMKLYIAFDIFKHMYNVSPSFSDENFRDCELTSPIVRKALGKWSVDAYVAHVLHIIYMNQQQNIGTNLQEIDYLMKGNILNPPEKTELFCKLMQSIDTSRQLNCWKSSAVVAYIVGKLQAQLNPAENVSQYALKVLNSFKSLRIHDVSISQLNFLKHSAEQMCTRAYPKTACVLLLMKYTFHLFSSTYFKTLHVNKVFPFSSGSADNDDDLRLKKFHELAATAMHDEDTNYLFESLVEDTPLHKNLLFHYEKHQLLVEKVEQLLEDRIKVAFSTLKETMNFKDLEELCLGISKHPSLVKNYSQALTKLVLQMLKAPDGKPLAEAELIRIIKLPVLFKEEKDKATLFLHTSKSSFALYHSHYLKILDEVLIDDPTIISKTAEDWLDVLVKEINQKFKMPTDGINMLYEKLQNLLSKKNVRCYVNLVRSLEEKVYRCLERIDVELILQKCLEKQFYVDDLFFVHLQKLANQKAEEVLQCFEKVLNPNEIERLGFGGHKVIEIGLEVLGKSLGEASDEDFYIILRHWRLCLVAIKSPRKFGHQENRAFKIITETRKKYWKCVKDKTMDVVVIRKIEEICKKQQEEFHAVKHLFYSFNPYHHEMVGNLKLFLEDIKKSEEDIKKSISVLEVILKRIDTETALTQAIVKVIKLLQEKEKDLQIGISVPISCISDRSFFEGAKHLLTLCQEDGYLVNSQVFQEILMHSDLFSSDQVFDENFVEVLLSVISKTKSNFQNYWLRVCSRKTSEIRVSELHVVTGDNLTHEVKIAEKLIGRKVPQEIYDALHLFGNYKFYEHKTEIIIHVFEVLDLNANDDPKFKVVLPAFRAVAKREEACTLETLVKASQTFKDINQMLDAETTDMLTVFSKSKSLLEFLREIQGEDLRNLIDAVEEHSEQSVQEITVSSLIDIRRFLKPLMEEDFKQNSVLKLLKIMETSQKENKLTKLATKLEECNTNLHSLKSLYHNVANRGEVTRDVVKALLEDDSVSFQFQITASKKVNLLVRYKGDRILNRNELNDYRSRALLLVSADTTELIEDSESQIKQFIQFVDSALTTRILYEQLVISGFPSLRISTLSVQRCELLEREAILKKRLLKWQQALEKARTNWYWLNHFYPEQIIMIQTFMKEGSNRDEVESLLRSAGCGSPWTENTEMVKAVYLNKSEVINDDEFALNTTGATLEELIKDELMVGPYFPVEDFDHQNVRPIDRVQSGELYVVNLTDNRNVIPCLITLYRNTTGHMPCHHQVLFCTEDTTWESIELHLNKCVFGKEKNFPKQLYCIVSVEKLCNEVQFKLVYKLKELGDSINYLAVICKGNNNHPLINHFSEQIHKLKPIINTVLQRCIQKLWPEIHVISSDLPGQGKTELIQCKAFNNSLELISLHVSGNVSEMTLITKLQELCLYDKSLLHLDIGSLTNGHETDVLLFKLTVLGFLSRGSKIFPRPTEYVSVEIANSINGTLQNSLPTTQYFMCDHLKWQDFSSMRVCQEINSPVQVVCHYVKAISEDRLDETDIYFSGDVVEEPLSESQCQDLLRKEFGNLGNLSFSIVNILLNVLADQLKKMSCSLFLRTSHLSAMVGPNNTVKSCLARAIFDVSRQFATRSVATCREEQLETSSNESKEVKIETMKTRDMATAKAMTERVKGMIQWEESNHLIISFHKDVQTFSALYRDLSEVQEYVKQLFETQMNKDLPDFSKMSSSDLKERLKQITMLKSCPEESSSEIDVSDKNSNYAMTPDNLLKMILIHMRMKSHIPVIIMGETGCGKTSLLQHLASVCEVRFLVKNMHAGIEEEDIVSCVEEASKSAREDNKIYFWLFFDEINTCGHMGLLNDLVCHHVFHGQKLPPNLSILAACNPYKLRKGVNILTTGLASKIKTDEQSRLVYRVHPLPESMVDYVWDFGSLTDSDERTYIRSMVETSVTHLQPDLLAELLVMSQAFIRRVEKSPYCVSLRDVNRCRLLVPWFRDEMLPELSVQKNPHLLEVDAVVMALAHSYHSRLNQTEDRKQYREEVAKLLNKYDVTNFYSIDCNGEYVFKIIERNQKAVLKKMDLPDGIARNTALQENVFVIFVCLLKRMPIFVVGKPGCSKSLSLQLLKSNLRGKDSKEEYFKKLPQMYYVSYQGSESSTSDGILKVFEKAQNYRRHNKEEDVLPVVILDEIGLAEISTYNPLKVLHSLLEPENQDFPDVAVVGISNWALDAAKMNRAIHLSRPEMDEEELHKTAISIAEASSETNLEKTLTQAPETVFLSDNDKQMLKALASAYHEYVCNQKIKNFHGLRDFYSLIKFISKNASSRSLTVREKYSFVLMGLLRNFGGLKSEIKYVKEHFNKHLQDFRVEDSSMPSLLDLVHDNINDHHARHLMLLTRGDSSLGILEDLLRSENRQYVTLLGSSFEEDQTDHYSYRILSKIILCMEQGITLILKDLETIYGSLYDMLNQNYTVVGKKKNCRIALGAYSNPLCQVHEKFRCIVLVEEDKIDLSDPPFLNRFEKQRLMINDVLNDEMKPLAKSLENFMEDLSKVSGYQYISPEDLVPIFNSDMIPSLVHSKCTAVKGTKFDIEDIECICRDKIITLCTPEGMVRAEKSALVTKDVSLLKELREKYFLLPVHDGLDSYLSNIVGKYENGVEAMIFTHSNIYTDLRGILKLHGQQGQFEKLGAFKSEKQLSSTVKQFWSNTEQKWFFIQVTHTDQQHFLLMKSVLEQERKQYLAASVDVKTFKHVAVIIHVDRTTKGSQMGLLNFLSGWHIAMVDTLEKHTYNLKRLLDGSLADLARKLLDDHGISKQDLFGAFTFISYTDKSRSMESMKRLVDIIYENDMIKGVLVEVIQKWIGVQDSLQTIKDWQLEVACNTAKLKKSLTFHGALMEEVKSKLRHPLAAAVFKVEKLNGWDYLITENHSSDMKDRIERWLSIARNKNVIDIAGIADPQGPECYPCKLTTLQTRFPFSSFFIQRIERLQRVFLDIWRAKQLETNREDESMCEKIYSLFRRSINNVASELFELDCDRGQFEDYFHDFCQWFTADLPLSMTENQRIEVIGQAMKSRTVFETQDFDLFVTKLHVTGWIHKYKLHSEIILIDTCLSQLTISLKDILTRAYSMKREMVMKSQKIITSGHRSPLSQEQEQIIYTRISRSEGRKHSENDLGEEDNIELERRKEYTERKVSYDSETVSESDITIAIKDSAGMHDEVTRKMDENHKDENDLRFQSDEDKAEGMQIKLYEANDSDETRHKPMNRDDNNDDDGDDNDEEEKDNDDADVTRPRPMIRNVSNEDDDDDDDDDDDNAVGTESKTISRSVIKNDDDEGEEDDDADVTRPRPMIRNVSNEDDDDDDDDAVVTESKTISRSVVKNDDDEEEDNDDADVTKPRPMIRNVSDDDDDDAVVTESKTMKRDVSKDDDEENNGDTSDHDGDEITQERELKDKGNSQHVQTEVKEKGMDSASEDDYDEESEDEDVVASSLVDLVCHYLIPSDQIKTKKVSEWQCMVNLVLSLTTDVSVQPLILQKLRACNDLASMLILPHGIDERHFWEIGKILSNHGLDSKAAVDALYKFVLEVKNITPPDSMQHFLSSYASCCLMADTQSEFVFTMFDMTISSVNDVNFLGSVMHHAIYLQYDKDPEELLEDENLNNEFFEKLGYILKTHQERISDSPFACIMVDLLQNHIFCELDKKLEDDSQGFLEKLLELKRQYITDKPTAVRSIIVIGYLKSSLKVLALYVKKKKPSDNLWQMINHLFEGGSSKPAGSVKDLQAYFIRCLTDGGGLQACEEVKRNFILLDFLSKVNTSPERSVQTNEQNPWFLQCGNNYNRIAKAAKFHDLLKKASDDCGMSFAFFAFAMNEFYLIKGRNLKKNEEDLARNLVSEAKSLKLQDHKVRLLSLLCQQEEFEYKLLQVPGSPMEHHMVSSILDLVSTIFSSVKCLDYKTQHILVDCICSPLSASKRPLPGVPEKIGDIHSFVRRVSNTTSFCVINCSCACRLLSKANKPLLCPNCKKELTAESFCSEDELTENEHEEMMKMDIDSHSDARDIDENTISDDLDLTSTIEQTFLEAQSVIGCMETVRDMTQVSFRIVQFMYFGCLAGGFALRYTTHLDLQSVLHVDDKSDPANELQENLKQQWEHLKTLLSMGDEQLSRFLHKVIHKCHGLLTEEKWHISTQEERDEFERNFTDIVTPLARRRFDLITEHVRTFNENWSEKGGAVENILCEVVSEDESSESYPCFWRDVMQPNTENMKSEFLLKECCNQFPVLSIVFMYDKELKMMKHIWSLLQWHIFTVKHLSYRYTKKECQKKTFGQFRHSLEEDDNGTKEVQLILKDFTQAWEDIINMKHVLAKYTTDIGPLENVHGNLELHKCIIMSTESQIYRVLKGLIKMQNNFLDDAMKLTVLHSTLSSSFLIRSDGCAAVPQVRIEDVAEHQIIKEPDFVPLLKFSQCNTKCGHGHEVIYDFYQIERDIALQCLMKKTHIILGDSFPHIAFSGEILHTTSKLLLEITQLVPQDPLAPETESQLDRMDPANRKVLMNYLEMTFCLIKRMSVTADDRKHNLGEFLEQWQYLFPYRVPDVDNFCSNICLCNTVCLFELVEQYMAEDVIDSLEDRYRCSMPHDGQMSLEGNDFADKAYLITVVTALSKFAYRNLQSPDISPEEQMSNLLKDQSLWPKGIIPKVNSYQKDSYISIDVYLLPPSICVKHIYHTIKFIKDKIQKLNQMAKSMDQQQQKKKESKAKKSKKWKK